MKILSQTDLIKNSIILENKWAVVLNISIDIFQNIFPNESFVLYLRNILKDDFDKLSYGLICGVTLCCFNSEEKANEFFNTIQEGSLLSAELYDNKGEFIGDNT